MASSIARVIVEVIVPSTRSSSAPVTVTVCGVSQFAAWTVSGLLTVVVAVVVVGVGVGEEGRGRSMVWQWGGWGLRPAVGG